MTEKIACPKCQRILELDASVLGQAVVCPHCNQKFMTGPTGISADPPATFGSITSSPQDAAGDKPRRPRYDDEDDAEDINIRTEVPNYLTQAILVTLCCCWPLGIVAIINAAKVNGLLASGDYQGAVEASEAAQKWCWISFILGAIINVIVFALQVTAEDVFR